MCPDNFRFKNLPEDVSALMADLLIADILKEDHCFINDDVRRFAGTFSPRAALYLLSGALVKGLPLKAFEAILEYSPPVAELFSDDNPSAVISRDSIDLIERLAYMDRADVLALLLERGASPNRVSHQEYGLSPLQEAVRNGSLKSLEILLRHPELDTSWPDQLLLEWAVAERADSARKQCLRAMSPRFTGCEAPPDRPLPIPEPMTAHIIASVHNWPLLERFCRERGRISPEDGQRAFRQVCFVFDDLKEEERSAHTAALAALLESCPGLLGTEEDCRALLRCFLGCGEEDRPVLRPWAESLGRRAFAVDASCWTGAGYGSLPELWRGLLPDGPILAVDRWDGLWAAGLSGENIGHILESCPVLGDGRKGELSPLAWAALRLCRPSMIDWLFRQSDGLLAAEDPNALADFVLKSRSCPRANRAAALSHVRREVDYDL